MGKGKGREMTTDFASAVAKQVIWPETVPIPQKANEREKRKDLTLLERVAGARLVAAAQWHQVIVCPR